MRDDPVSGALSGAIGGAALAAFGLALTTRAAAQQPSEPVRPSSAVAAPATSVPPDEKRRLEPKAIEILRASSGRLAAARTLRFTAVTS